MPFWLPWGYQSTTVSILVMGESVLAMCSIAGSCRAYRAPCCASCNTEDSVYTAVYAHVRTAYTMPAQQATRCCGHQGSGRRLWGDYSKSLGLRSATMASTQAHIWATNHVNTRVYVVRVSQGADGLCATSHAVGLSHMVMVDHSCDGTVSGYPRSLQSVL